MIYRDKIYGTIVRVVTGADYQGKTALVIYELVNGFGGKYAEGVDRFSAKFERVEFKCGVDLYAILHEVLGRDAAWEYAQRIEDALAARALDESRARRIEDKLAIGANDEPRSKEAEEATGSSTTEEAPETGA